ncbi:MAG: prealbumin-like fold domain-containing protein [Cytophagales bacterium]|nr:prealbumin-like fold domain-containing protein [Cytophagales bacterium]MDW8385282.1 SpaA isopeptide-forming pilin-related protein [Flammeovirgaceae bacterium]
MKKIFWGLLSIVVASTQFLSTVLKVTVLDDAGNIQKGAVVKLYKTEEDYKEDKNPVGGPQTTDEKGKVQFKDLEPQVYYVRAQKGDKDNSDGGIKTHKLDAGKINKINVIISD